MVLDIRSISVSTNQKTNLIHDQKITRSASCFDHVTVITENVRDHLNIPQNKASILPIGTNINSNTKKNFYEALNLLYIGTYKKRNINQTIEGLAIFIENNPNQSIKYYLVGDGTNQDISSIKNQISKNNLGEIVHLLGYKRHVEIQDLWDFCQIGIAYVPISYGYNLQPPTKTLEYLGAGMAVIATKTHENMRVINDKNGVLIEDSPVMFSQGLERMVLNRKFYNSDLIRESVEKSKWELIVKKYFLNLFGDHR
jgi:glycosyltransferase involved in cell wall biosynthesis